MACCDEAGLDIDVNLPQPKPGELHSVATMVTAPDNGLRLREYIGRITSATADEVVRLAVALGFVTLAVILLSRGLKPTGRRRKGGKK